MKMLFDFFPVIFFFIAYKLFDIYVATVVAMVASLLQVGIFWIKNRRFELIHLIALALIFILGSATIVAHNPMFIKWKPTVIYWIMAVIFLCSRLGKKTVLEHMMDKKITLPTQVWKTLNYNWIIFFVIMGGINLLVVYNCSTNTWVNFKLFGIFGVTVIFGILQLLWVEKFAKK
jgi:intracellular septation protein